MHNQPFRAVTAAAILAVVAALLAGCRGAGTAVYKDPRAAVEKRVEDLLSRMSPEEKADLLSGNTFETQSNQRLGIPAIRMADGPMGVRWYKATAFPASVAMAAAWDPDLTRQAARAIARELRAQDRDMLLAPCVNIHRVPMGGRNFESYGEDPYLAARMAVGFIKGVQGEGVIATVKHFAANNQETERDSIDVQVDERVLNEIYFPAFRAAVQEAGVWTVMSSYNKLNGAWASENPWLLTEVLKKQWGFQGLVVSDWGAVHSTVATANAGCDLEMPTGKFLNRAAILKAITEGQVLQATVDDKVRRLLRVLFLSGRFDRRPGEKAGELNTPAHQQLARTAAVESTVLLKNQGGLLPLDPARVRSVAVIGPNAAMGRVGGGGAALVNYPYVVSPLEGLKSRLGGQMQIHYAPGLIQVGDLFPIETSWFTPPGAKAGEHGLRGEYFNNKELGGSPVLTRIDPNVDFRWGAATPGPGVIADGFSVRWSGTLTVPKTADYYLDGFGDDGTRLILDGKTLYDSWGKPRKTYTAEVRLEAGRPYALRFEYYENFSAATARLGWREKTGDITPAAVAAAAKSDVALVFAGLSDYFESETFDRADLELPKGQAALIEAVARANPNTVVVINAGSPVQVSAWLDKVRAVVMAWYPGQEDGNAIAAVLAGDADPGGRLPMSWPKQWKDSAAYGKYPGEKGAVPYSEGLFVGYRHFDRAGVEPQFPFGYGLSYTQFAYSNLRVEPGKASSNQRIRVSCEVQNTGTPSGSEVVQLYVRDVEASVPRPVKELKAFEKIRLKPGEKRQVSFDLGPEALSFYDVAKHEWVAEPGAFEMLVGRSSRDIQLRGSFELAK